VGRQSFKALAEAPPSTLAGVNQQDAERLAQALGIRSIRAMANSQVFKLARAMVIAADLKE
jgi:hypothetical protein